MASAQDVIVWLRDPRNNVPDCDSISQLEPFRSLLADHFELKETNRAITEAFEEYIRTPKTFRRTRLTAIVDEDRLNSTEWIGHARTRSGQPNWERLKSFLEKERKRAPETLSILDDESEQILRLLADPSQAGTERVGLVVGYVQSGKTANMAALMSKAADAGYRIFIVLAGVLDTLRQQTQLRLDQELTGGGAETFKGSWRSMPRVKRFQALNVPAKDWGRGTSADPESPKIGEIKKQPASADVVDEGRPRLFVIKKTPKRLEALRKFLEESAKEYSGSTKFKVPVLIIDDEADQATINIGYKKGQVATTNKEIRMLLNCFETRTYVGYTATPFANFLIDPRLDPQGATFKEIGADLFPKDFIVSLSKPVGYFGAKELFGLSDPNDPEAALPGLPIFREVPQNEANLFKTKGLSQNKPEAIVSLETAFISFLLSCATRELRGHEKSDMTMLIHPSSQTAIHERIRLPVEKLVKNMRGLIESGDKAFSTKAKELWESDFKKTTEKVNLTLLRPEEIPSFEKVWSKLLSVVDALEVKLLNSGSPDTLQYHDPEVPRRYVVIGGNKLSRGLTLEGLSVSYFLRNSVTYDTLLQMGRWFGYRQGYVDLTRLFMQPGARESFAQLAVVEQDLRDQLEVYSREGIKPLQMPPRIRVMPSLAVTGPAKMGAGQREIDFSEQPAQVSKMEFFKPNILSERNEKVLKFLSEMQDLAPVASWSENRKKRGFYIWKKPTTTAKIVDLISGISLGNINKEFFTEYLRKKTQDLPWYVALAGREEGQTGIKFDQLGLPEPVFPVVRRYRFNQPNHIGNPSSPTDLELTKVFCSHYGINQDNAAFLIIYIVDGSVETLWSGGIDSCDPNYKSNPLPFLTAPVFRIPRQKAPGVVVTLPKFEEPADEQDDAVEPDEE